MSTFGEHLRGQCRRGCACQGDVCRVRIVVPFWMVNVSRELASAWVAGYESPLCIDMSGGSQASTAHTEEQWRSR